jgi:uncharacterized protein involved in exopolysaccharide biosynthesis
MGSSRRSWFLLAIARVFALFAAAFAVLLRPRPDGPEAV